MRKLTYFLTNPRTSAAICNLLLANVHKLVRKFTYFLTNVRTSAAVCKLILANVHKLVRKFTYLSTNVRISAAVCKLILTNVHQLVRKLPRLHHLRPPNYIGVRQHKYNHLSLAAATMIAKRSCVQLHSQKNSSRPFMNFPCCMSLGMRATCLSVLM